MKWLDPAQLPVAGSALVFIVAAVIVWIAGAKLARVADAIATQTGVGREFLGLVLLGGVTSLPELSVGTVATLQGTPVLSVNDVLGSASINIVILAFADAVSGRGALTSKQGSPRVLLQGVLSVGLFAVVAAAVVTGDRLILGVGGWCWLMLAAYVGAMWLLSRTQSAGSWRAPPRPLRERSSPDEGAEEDRLAPLIWIAAASAAAILVAGFALARTGEALAESTGLGTSFFGAVFLGFSTSLPEVSTVVAAVRLRQYEMAISDVFGTNLFNITILVLVDALHPGGPVLIEAGRFAGFGALLALVLTAFFVAGMIERRDRTLLRMGFDSVAVLVMYAAGVVVLHGLR